MRILYDYQIMLMQRYGGISREFCEVAFRLQNTFKNNVSVVAKGSQNYYLEKLLGQTAVDEITVQDRSKMSEYVRHNQQKIIRMCRNQEYDILHSTWYDSYLYQIEGCKHVTTINDMIQEIYPLYMATEDLVHNKRRIAEEADGVIVISEHTKKDLLNLYPHISEEKIFVVYPGGELRECYKISGMQVPERFLLYVGGRNNYKNFDTFYFAAEMLMKRYKDLYLVCVGGGTFSNFENRLMYDMREKIIHINASEEQLEYLYRHAAAFVFPSKYEGFGIPIIEAFSCGCPVVLSEASCFPEIADDAAIYFNPNDVEDMACSIERALFDQMLRNEKIQKGLLRAEDFSWDNSAANMHKAYEKILQR